jgi:hypothetical protein
VLAELSDRTRRRLRTVLTIVTTAAIIAPVAAFATGGFNDVQDSDFFADAVGWMKDNGVTVGCNPPDNTRYCPDDFVTRGQMAVFMQRLDTEEVFVTLNEMDGLLPIATVLVDGEGRMVAESFRDPVTDIRSGGDRGRLTLVVEGLESLDGARIVCTPERGGDRSVTVERDLNVITVKTWSPTSTFASADVSCAIYG